MNLYINKIQEAGRVSTEEAQELFDTIESEALIDWSEATARQIVKATYIAQAFIANGRSWE